MYLQDARGELELEGEELHFVVGVLVDRLFRVQGLFKAHRLVYHSTLESTLSS